MIDLQGIISNVDEGEDESNIDLIKNLVTKTIDGNCLILLTLSMRGTSNFSRILHRRVDDRPPQMISRINRP